MSYTQYELSRSFWDFAFENPEKIKPSHCAIFFFAVEHCNRMGWVEKFGLPTAIVLSAIGSKDYHSYKKYFDDLIEWGFFIIIQYSKNQHSSNIISLSISKVNSGKALDKTIQKRLMEKPQSIPQSTDICIVEKPQSIPQSVPSINKPITVSITKEEVLLHTPEELELIEVYNSMNTWISKNAKNILGMSEQITLNEFVKLVEDFGVEYMKDMFLKMHNWKKIKNNTNVNLTFRNWAKRDGYVKPVPKNNNSYRQPEMVL